MGDPQEKVEELEEALHATYTMLDRYANEVSDEAYRAIEGEIIQKTDPDLAKAHKHPLEAEVEELRDIRAAAIRVIEKATYTAPSGKEYLDDPPLPAIISLRESLSDALDRAEDNQNA